jgi:hypothetical protein
MATATDRIHAAMTYNTDTLAIATMARNMTAGLRALAANPGGAREYARMTASARTTLRQEWARVGDFGDEVAANVTPAGVAVLGELTDLIVACEAALDDACTAGIRVARR